LAVGEIAELLKQVEGWEVDRDGHLSKTFTFPDFAQALAFVNAVGVIAEKEAHHPDMTLSWGRVSIELWTHKINGLTQSDFILAAKIGEITSEHIEAKCAEVKGAYPDHACS
jgi:4a-hydroxytetrahydrobiopterin dehydratase